MRTVQQITVDTVGALIETSTRLKQIKILDSFLFIPAMRKIVFLIFRFRYLTYHSLAVLAL
jgi:hypothetical protein